MILIKPHITEKSLIEAAKKRYTFVVAIEANKTQIKKEVEKLFGVKVLAVTTAIMHGKAYRKGKRWQFGQRSEWKKAVVAIKPDQSIDLFVTESK